MKIISRISYDKSRLQHVRQTRARIYLDRRFPMNTIQCRLTTLILERSSQNPIKTLSWDFFFFYVLLGQ